MRIHELLRAAFATPLIFCLPALAVPMSIQEAVDLALSEHPSLKTAEARAQAAKASHRALWESYAPQVTLFGGAQRNMVSGSTTTTTPGLLGSMAPVTQNFSQSDTEAIAGGNVEEFLFDFGIFSSQRRAADERYGAQKEAVATQRLDVTLNVKLAYYGLLRMNRLLRFSQDAVDQRRAQMGQIAALAGKDSRHREELLQANRDLANARLNLARSERDVAAAEAALSDALGESKRSSHSIVDDVTMKMFRLDRGQAIERALNGRPELAQVQAIVRAQKADIDATWASYFPRVSSIFSVVSLTPTGSASFDQLTVVGGGIKVGVPTTGLVSTGRLEQAKAGLPEAKSREDELRRAITLAVDRSYDELEEAVERVRIAEELVNNTNRHWQETQSRYHKGLATTGDKTTAYVFLYDARVNLIQALYDAKIAEARLERSIGMDF